MAFFDDFTGVLDDSLESRSGWTRVDGAVGAAKINGSNQLKNTSTQSVGSYTCTDQGDANHYTQAELLTGGNAIPVAVRLTDGNNWIGGRHDGQWRIYKRDAGSFTLLGSYSVTLVSGDVARLEADDNNITLLVNGITRIGPVIDAFNNTETRQGTCPRLSITDPWIDNFEAGALGAAGGTTLNRRAGRGIGRGIARGI